MIVLLVVALIALAGLTVVQAHLASARLSDAHENALLAAEAAARDLTEFATTVAARALAAFEQAEQAHQAERGEYRLERAAVMRALMARNGMELARLDRVASETDARRATTGSVTADDPRRSITQEEYEAILREDFAGGLGGESGLVPANPEGM